MTAQSYASATAVKVRLNIGTADTTDDALITTICGQVNDWLEDEIGRPVGPLASQTYTFDGDGSDCLYVRQGIRTITTLSIAPVTGDTKVAETNFVLLPRVQDRRTGWPAFEVKLTDLSTAVFYRGFGNVEIVGDFGWEAIPPDLKEIAEVAVVRAWHARQTGQTDIVGTDETGNPVVSRFISGKDMKTIRRYKVDYLVGG